MREEKKEKREGRDWNKKREKKPQMDSILNCDPKEKKKWPLVWRRGGGRGDISLCGERGKKKKKEQIQEKKGLNMGGKRKRETTLFAFSAASGRKLRRKGVKLIERSSTKGGKEGKNHFHKVNDCSKKKKHAQRDYRRVRINESCS